MKLSRVSVWLCAAYFILMVVIITFGTLKYGHLRGVSPDQALASPPGAVNWFSAYAGFMEISIILSAILVGLWAALLGVLKGSVLKGIGFLAAGVIVTYLGYSILPRLYFPGGDLNSGGYWLTYGFYVYTGTWLLATLLGYFLLHREKVQ